ncbi:hypothetical protein WICPIJ_009578, partial [Wickerhamomyces pijperi]
MPHNSFNYGHFETPVRDQKYDFRNTVHNSNVDTSLARKEQMEQKQLESFARLAATGNSEFKSNLNLLSNAVAATGQNEEESTDGNYFPTKVIFPSQLNATYNPPINMAGYQTYGPNDYFTQSNNQVYPNQMDFGVNQIYAVDLEKHLNIFPHTFDPRNAPNMPHREKVDKWIEQVPVYLLSTRNHYSNVITEQVWHSECYPGVVPGSSSSLSPSNQGLNYLPEVSEYDNYNNDMNDILVDKDDILEFQSRKITMFAFEFYHRDIDDPVHKGHPDYRNPGRHPDSQMQTHSRHREKEKEKTYRESSRLAKSSHRYVDPLLVKQKDPLGDSNFMNYLDNSTNDNL